MVISSKGSAKVADRSPFKIHRELKLIPGKETIEVTKLASGDLMVELKSNDQVKKLGAIATFLDIPVTVSSHKSLTSSMGIILSRDLQCCSEEEMVEELSGVTHAWRIKRRPCSQQQDLSKVLGKSSHSENGGTFQQARMAVVVEIHKMISKRTFASAIKTQLRTKPAALPKDGRRSALSAPPKGEKAQKDSQALSPQRAAETEVLAKRRAEKSKRQEAPRETLNRFAPLAMNAENTISSIWGDSDTPSSSRAPPPLWNALHPPPKPTPSGETPRSSTFLLASLPFHPRGPCDGGVEGY
ncbi:Gag-like protein [Plakobranchus ocellatus]|uniref:Gag-like protein n=1 Tax=Plakobranchus ocellatus TaxID=259542 RepID=A0AAV4AGJ1_9GAST|nr:Gag-like protein [Plakobranchus ocellatus]